MKRVSAPALPGMPTCDLTHEVPAQNILATGVPIAALGDLSQAGLCYYIAFSTFTTLALSSSQEVTDLIVKGLYAQAAGSLQYIDGFGSLVRNIFVHVVSERR